MKLQFKPTVEEINAKVVEKIRERYDVNKEFAMINLGINDPMHADFIAYREYVNECKEWGRLEKEKYGLV